MRWFRAWFRRGRLERNLARELDAHLDLHVHRLLAGGASIEEARRQARIALGGVDQVKEQVRDARAGAWFDGWLHDVRDAFRGLKRTPGVTATAVALIALVIGGNTTIYSMVHAVIAKPAPGVRGDGLVVLERRVDGRPVGPEHSFPEYLAYASQASSLSPLLASQFHRFAAGIGEATLPFQGGLVSSNYFDTLGVRMLRGRTFTDADQTSPDLVAIVSERIWRTQFGSAEDIIGRSIALNGHAATIVGVAPPGFRGAWIGDRSDIWVPLLAFHAVRGSASALADRDISALAATLMIGRLRPGVSLAQAGVEISTISARLQVGRPVANRHESVGLVPYSMTAGGDSLVAQAPRFLAIFSVVTALTLAIVCANIANLMLGRALARRRELALRQTLGASRARILRTLVAEGCLISIAAWLAACVCALAVSKGVIHLVSQGEDGLTLDLTPDWQVIAYAFGLAIVGTMAFTIAPAVRAWKQELLPSLRSGELGVVAGRSKLSGALVVVQLGFAVLLLTSAGLAYRSLDLLGSRETGYRAENLVHVSVEAGEAVASDTAHIALLDRLRERLRAVPGVQSVAYTQPDGRSSVVQAEGDPVPRTASTATIGPGYFSVLGMVPLAGREFAAGEALRATQPAIITRHLADSLWPGQSPIGRTLQLGPGREPAEVVGVVPNGVFSRYQREAAASYVFLSLQQKKVRPGSQYFTVVLRHSGALEQIAPAIHRAIHEVDKRVPATSVRTMKAELDEFTSVVRVITIWITLFAAGSLMIAAIGQYAVIAFDMRRRTRDFGVRLALGASSRQILGSVIGDGLRWTAAGLLVGCALSVAAGLVLRGLLVGVTPTDPPTYAGVFIVLLVASMLACYLPARRAARIDPIQALRQE